jgi:hypothetical protein
MGGDLSEAMNDLPKLMWVTRKTRAQTPYASLDFRAIGRPYALLAQHDQPRLSRGDEQVPLGQGCARAE